MRHKCCQGTNPCVETCLDSQGRKTEGNYKPLVDCHHPKLDCKFQFTWFGHAKYCDCIKHEERQNKKSNNEKINHTRDECSISQ